MSKYLSSGQYAAYGLPQSTTDAQVQAASALIDGRLGRPEGLVWSPDVTGLPCFMAAAVPTRTWAIQADIEPGSNVTVALDSAPPASVLGETLVLDAPTPSGCEAAVVTAIDGNSVTFGTIVRVHSATSPAALGLVISERQNVGYQAPVAFLSRTPVARLIALGTRWDRSSIREPSLSDSRWGRDADRFDMEIGPVPIIGMSPQWTLLDPSVIDFDIATGKLDVGVVGTRSEVRACYLAGYTLADLPDQILQVCARLVLSIQSVDPDMPSNAKLYKAGDTAIQRFADSLFDDDMDFQLKPYMARKGL